MTELPYRRVSRKRLCVICGKPDWCSFTPDDRISFCARVNYGADRISKYGWGVFYNQDLSYLKTQRCEQILKKPSASDLIAPPRIRDRVYRKLIELYPASMSDEIMNGPGGLAERGINDYSQYGSLPTSARERNELARHIFESLADEFGNSVPIRPNPIGSIPGFWTDEKGRFHLWSAWDTNEALLLIPFVGPEGLVRACQIRFMTDVGDRSGRYVWLSSSNRSKGCGPGSPLHHAAPGSHSQRPVLVTEGALKAATTQKFLTDRYVVGNSGVATAHHEIVETARGRPLEIAFDNDSFTNPHVARALAALIRLRRSDQNSFAYSEEVRIVTWDRSLKGIDEALLADVRLQYLTVPEWLEDLSPECLEQANQQISALGRKEAVGRVHHEPVQ